MAENTRLKFATAISEMTWIEMNDLSDGIAQAATAWAYRSAAQSMMKLRKEIGAEAHDIHAIRHTVASELGASGVDDDGIMAMTGHTTKGMVAHYAGRSRQIVRAEKAQKDRK